MYKNIGGGNAPRFCITCGLAEGYGPSAKTHAVSEVVEHVLDHLMGLAASGRPYLTGTVTASEVVYAWPEGPGKAGGGHEPVARYKGEVNPLYNSSMSREAIEEFLNNLASSLGSAFGQTRVYVAFAGDMWILQREESTTPTGETA
jgi:hypothetical protein